MIARAVLLPISCLLLGLCACRASSSPKSVTIATVNNPDMLELIKLSSKFEQSNPDIKINWVTFDENTLRQRVTTDVSAGSGRYDLVFLGLYETPLFSRRGWLRPIVHLPPDYDLDDIFQTLRDGGSFSGQLYALPFYGESSMLMYRKDLLGAKGLRMPDQPTYADVQRFAAALTDKSLGICGIALRGKPGWGENMAFLTTMVYAYGGAWFSEAWRPLLDTPEWQRSISDYVDLVCNFGPAQPTEYGFIENLMLFASGRAAMWIDATVAGGMLENSRKSQVAGKVGYAPAPVAQSAKGSHWLWSWVFAVPASAKAPDEAQRFAVWATSKQYIALVAQDLGWASVPPGTRRSTYANPDYRVAAPFADVTLRAIESADPRDPCARKVPYEGVQFVDIPEFQFIGTVVGQNIADALAGKESVQQALGSSQAAVEQVVTRSGYLKPGP